MLGIGKFIRRYPDPLEAELVLMHHYAVKQKALHSWDRRYAHMQFVLRWAPVFRRHALPAPNGRRDSLAA
jgi:hypothetical protein